MQLCSLCSRFTICGDACPLSCVSAEACLTGWPNAWVHRGGKLVNAALLSLINEASTNICCATLLSNELLGPACVQARSSNPRGRVCRPNGKGLGKEGILSDVVPVYLYCPAFSVKCFFRRLIQACIPADRLATQHTSHRQPRPNLAVRVDRAYRKPTNMQPGTFSYRWLRSG